MAAILCAKDTHRCFTLRERRDKVNLNRTAVGIKASFANTATLANTCIDHDTINMTKVSREGIKHFKNRIIITNV